MRGHAPHPPCSPIDAIDAIQLALSVEIPKQTALPASPPRSLRSSPRRPPLRNQSPRPPPRSRLPVELGSDGVLAVGDGSDIFSVTISLIGATGLPKLVRHISFGRAHTIALAAGRWSLTRVPSCGSPISPARTGRRDRHSIVVLSILHLLRERRHVTPVRRAH